MDNQLVAHLDFSSPIDFVVPFQVPGPVQEIISYKKPEKHFLLITFRVLSGFDRIFRVSVQDLFELFPAWSAFCLQFEGAFWHGFKTRRALARIPNRLFNKMNILDPRPSCFPSRTGINRELQNDLQNDPKKSSKWSPKMIQKRCQNEL